MNEMQEYAPRFFIVAGEASGDALAASLMRGLRARYPAASFAGVGGPLMQAEGMESLFPMQELSVMGLAEVLPKLFGILSRLRQCRRRVLEMKPDALITIDSPDFCFRLSRSVKESDPSIPCVHYVAPSVWAWRPGRAKMVAQFLDRLLALLPFEPSYFEQHGLKTDFVGHPIVERMGNRGDAQRFREKHRLSPSQPVLCMLPGSRMSELSRLLEKFAETADIVLQRRHDMVVAIPTLPHLKPCIEEFFVGRGINPLVLTGDQEKFDCFAASSVAIAASGTVSLELAMSDTPHIIAYKLSPVSAWAAKHLVKTPFVNLINILLKRRSVPELLLEDCEPRPMAAALLTLLEDKTARATQLADFREAMIMLGLGDPETPGQKAAHAVADLLEKRKA